MNSLKQFDKNEFAINLELAQKRRELLLVSFCEAATHIDIGVKEGSLVWPVCLLASLSLSEWIIQLFPLCGQFAEWVERSSCGLK